MLFWNSKWICCNPLQKMSPPFCFNLSVKMVSRKASQHWFQVHLEELEQVLVLHVDEVKDRFEMFRDLLWACGNPAKFENETQHTGQLRLHALKQCWKSFRFIACSALNSLPLSAVTRFSSTISEVWTIVSDLAIGRSLVLRLVQLDWLDAQSGTTNGRQFDSILCHHPNPDVFKKVNPFQLFENYFSE